MKLLKSNSQQLENSLSPSASPVYCVNTYWLRSLQSIQQQKAFLQHSFPNQPLCRLWANIHRIHQLCTARIHNFSSPLKTRVLKIVNGITCKWDETVHLLESTLIIIIRFSNVRMIQFFSSLMPLYRECLKRKIRRTRILCLAFFSLFWHFHQQTFDQCIRIDTLKSLYGTVWILKHFPYPIKKKKVLLGTLLKAARARQTDYGRSQRSAQNGLKQITKTRRGKQSVSSWANSAPANLWSTSTVWMNPRPPASCAARPPVWHESFILLSCWSQEAFVFSLMSCATEQEWFTMDFHVYTSSTPGQCHSGNWDHIPAHW